MSVQRSYLLAGPQLDLPHDVTPKQLETLLNGLLKQEEKLPYSFFVNDQQLSQELGAHLLQHKVSILYTLTLMLQISDVASGPSLITLGLSFPSACAPALHE